jgi:transcriptional regulator with XRE-family HTH domain
MKFSERLKDLRIEKGITQQAVAKETGLSQNAIAQWENAKRVPNANAIILLAKFFNVTADYLLGMDDF